MVCISVFYPTTPGKKFDHDYYAQSHMPLVMRTLKNSGLLRYEVDTGLSGGMPGTSAPFTAVARLYFNTLEEFEAAFAAHSAGIIADVPNYTDIPLQIQVSQLATS